MIEGGLPYVYASYAVTGAMLGGLVIVVLARAVHWAREAKRFENRR
ncbi:MAG: heme exporter protein CcmD [Hyphomonadaceae bacterium]